ncbi:hypothetical protein L249_0600 [Ophiocordyceps polyrhachis-furcata BCC 54312]|uniref:Uncharacterized protein n=1 Tax=Ophiocordyceps polyrhachis-furcata BCC 54312 TaxID=1330021 RepID=A0A367LDJ5_9HYPO|nr:hypothetical protein L249_0600 [Ophiocordyceps polyrhachis-furcata BCC 54312]
MRYAIVSAAFIVGASAHGLPVAVIGANGVMMPGLSVTDGTPRDCSTNGCGSQADTTILRDREMKQNPLGRTQGNGPVSAQNAIENFMGKGKSTLTNQNSKGVGQEDDLSQLQNVKEKRLAQRTIFMRGLLGGLLDGLTGGGGGGGGGAKAQGKKSNFASETSVADTAGKGAESGLPTVNEQNEVEVVYRQINQDGAGPLKMECDATSCGTQNDAFQPADIGTNVPGAILGLSTATNTEFGMKCSLPQGMVCKASCGGAQNVCVCRMRNNTPAGPFGGSFAVTQSQGAVKRAVMYRLRKRYQINRVDREGTDSENSIETRMASRPPPRLMTDPTRLSPRLISTRKKQDQQLAAQGFGKRSAAATADDRSTEALAAADLAEEKEDQQLAAQGFGKRSVAATTDDRSSEALAAADLDEEKQDQQLAAQGFGKRSVAATADDRSSEALAAADLAEEKDDKALANGS